MTTAYAELVRRALLTAGTSQLPPPPKSDPTLGSWRYPDRRAPRSLLILAIVLSAGLHAGILFGFTHRAKAVARAPEKNVIALTLTIPDLKDLEEPEPEPVSDERAAKPDLSVPVPSQADLPQLPQPADFVQQIDFSSLLEKPDFSKTDLLAVPESFRRGTKIAESIGSIFNLADLDRHPEPVVQPAPLYPIAMRREGVTATVIIEFIVDTQGRAVNAVAAETTQPGFEEAAIVGVQRWRFRPGIRGGRKVNTRMRVPIQFTILDSVD